MKKGTCIKCQSTKIQKFVSHDNAGDSVHQLKLKQHGDPNAWIFKDTTYFPLYALGCTVCGYVEFYMQDFS